MTHLFTYEPRKIDKWLGDHYLPLSLLFSGSYLVGVILIPVGLLTGLYGLSYAGVIAFFLFAIMYILGPPIDTLLQLDSPEEIDPRSRLCFLQATNFFAWTAIIMPSVMLSAFVVTVYYTRPSLLYSALLGGVFELACIGYFQLWITFRSKFLGLNRAAGASAFSWLGWILLSESEKNGLAILDRALQLAKEHFALEGVSAPDLDRLRLAISLYSMHTPSIAFSEFSQLAHALIDFPLYRNFSEAATRFLSNPQLGWIRSLDYVKPKGRLTAVGLILSILALLVGLTTEQIRTYILTAMGQAASGIGQLLLVLAVYFGTVGVITRAFSIFVGRIERSQLLLLQSRLSTDSRLDDFVDN